MPNKSKRAAARAQSRATADAQIELMHRTVTRMDDLVRTLNKSYQARLKGAKTPDQISAVFEAQCIREHRAAVAAGG